MKHLYKLTGFDGSESEVQADNYHRDDDYNIFTAEDGSEVARVLVLEAAMIRTTPAI